MNNVWKPSGFPIRYRLSHPIKQIRSFNKCIKWSFQRITKGWCDSDTWNIDWWFLEIMPDMLDYLRVHTHGYPSEFYIEGDIEEKGFDKWQEILKEMADDFRKAAKCVEEYNQEYDEWKNKGFELFVKWFWNLWD